MKLESKIPESSHHWIKQKILPLANAGGNECAAVNRQEIEIHLAFLDKRYVCMSSCVLESHSSMQPKYNYYPVPDHYRVGTQL